MAGRGPAPKPASQRRRANPAVHEWRQAAGRGWQHGEIPKPPAGLKAASREAWQTWFRAWFAWFWSEEDLPALRHVIRLYDQVERGEFQRSAELRIAMDTYGITPKGRQDRRWLPPTEEPAASVSETPGTVLEGRWGDLQVVDGA